MIVKYYIGSTQIKKVFLGMSTVYPIATLLARVSEAILAGRGKEAVDYAVKQVAGNVVEWVIDTNNNAIKYKPNADGGGAIGSQNPTSKIIWSDGMDSGYIYPTAVVAARARCSLEGQTYTKIYGVSIYGASVQCKKTAANGGGADYWGVQAIDNPAYDATATPPDAQGYKSIPIDTVAAKVILNAEGGHAPSQEFLNGI